MAKGDLKYISVGSDPATYLKVIDNGNGTSTLVTSDDHSVTWAPVTGNVAAVAGTLVADVTNISNVVASVAGTFAGANITFEASNDGGTTWFGTQVARTNASIVEIVTGVIASPVLYMWEIPVNGFTHLRVRATALTSGTMIWRFTGSNEATEPAPVVTVSGTIPVSMATNTAATPTGTNYALTGLATTNLVSVVAAACNLFELTVFNPTAATVYVKLYNKATAPVVATDVPLVVYAVAAGATLSQEFGRIGKRFLLGMGLAITGAAANTDATAVAAGVLVSATRV